MLILRKEDLEPFSEEDIDLVKDAIAEAAVQAHLGQVRAFVLSSMDETGNCRSTILGHPLVLARILQESLERIASDIAASGQPEEPN